MYQICDSTCDSSIIQRRYVVHCVKNHSPRTCISNGISYRCMEAQHQFRAAHNKTIQIHHNNYKRHSQHHSNHNKIKHNNRYAQPEFQSFSNLQKLFKFINYLTSTAAAAIASSWSKARKSGQSNTISFVCDNNKTWIYRSTHKHHTGSHKSSDCWWQTIANVSMGWLWSKQSGIISHQFWHMHRYPTRHISQK